MKNLIMIPILIASTTLFSGCTDKTPKKVTDHEGIKFELKQNEDNGKYKTVYYAVDSDGKLVETKKFKADEDVDVTDVFTNEIESDSDSPENINFNHVDTKKYKEFKKGDHKTVVYFPINKVINGKNVKYTPNETVKKIVDEYVQNVQEHWLSDFKVIEYKNEYYVFVGLNVGWVDPVYFYKYDSKTGTLKKLGELDNVEFLGISK